MVGAPVLAELSVRVARKTLLTEVAAACALLAATTLVVLTGSVLMRHRARRAVRTRTNTVSTLLVPAPPKVHRTRDVFHNVSLTRIED